MRKFPSILFSIVFAICLMTLKVMAQDTQSAQCTTLKVCEVEKAQTPCKTKPYREVIVQKLVTERNEKDKKAALKKVSYKERRALMQDTSYYPPNVPKRKLESIPQKQVLLGETGFHPFVNTMHIAYANHYPMTISPDMIWLLIAQGFANHVNQNGEELREYFVDFEGKKLLNINRDNFAKGSERNDWEGTFVEFSELIEANTGADLLELITGDFSTTTPAEKAAFQITLMDAMKSYFLYSATTSCGIPEITIEGTLEDWKSIEEKTQALAQYDLEWWTSELLPVLQKITETVEGNSDMEFWNSMYKWNQPGSGSPYITGWVLKFFPYIKSHDGTLIQFINAPNPRTNKIRYNLTATTKDFTSGISKADFLWNYFDTFYQMELVAGFVGYQQDPQTLSLRPEISWAVIDKQTPGTNEEIENYKNGGTKEYLESIEKK